MKNLLYIELRKSLKNKFFIFSVAFGFVISFFSFLYNFELYRNEMEEIILFAAEFEREYNPHLGISTLYNSWVGGEASTLGSTVFFFIFPLLIAIPYGWSYCSEMKSGYVKNVVIRSGRMKYFLSKYIATFISGGLAMMIPLIMNLMLTASFIPAYKPDVRYMQYYGIFSNTFMSEIFYQHPNLYVFIYLLIDFFFCGLIACLSCTAANIIKSKVVAILSPFGALLALNYIADIYRHDHNMEISPMNFLRPCPVSDSTTWIVILIEIVALILITLLPMIIRGKKHEIY